MKTIKINELGQMTKVLRIEPNKLVEVRYNKSKGSLILRVGLGDSKVICSECRKDIFLPHGGLLECKNCRQLFMVLGKVEEDTNAIP